MTHSLFLAQQSANHRLEELEDQVMDDVAGENYIASADLSWPLPASSSSANVVIRSSGNRSPAMNDAMIPDKDTGEPRQRDVWIETKVCDHFPLKILVSCKRYKAKLNQQHLDAFIGELRSSGH